MTNGIIEIPGDVCQLAIPYFIWVLLPFQYFPSLANLTQNEPLRPRLTGCIRRGGVLPVLDTSHIHHSHLNIGRAFQAHL
jgi:hypothetical protein